MTAHILLRRQRQELVVPVPDASREVALERLEARPRQQYPVLYCRVREDDVVRATVVSGGRRMPAPFRGRLTGNEPLMLAGTVTESRTELIWAPLFAFLALFMGAVGIIVAVHGQPWPGSAICLPAAVVFGLLAPLLARGRRSSFARDVSDLERMLTARLAAYDSRRP